MVSREGRRTADNSINHYQVIAVNFFFFSSRKQTEKTCSVKTISRWTELVDHKGTIITKTWQNTSYKFFLTLSVSGIGGRNKYYISIVGTVRFLLPVFLLSDHPFFHFTFSDGRTKVAGAMDKMIYGCIA